MSSVANYVNLYNVKYCQSFNKAASCTYGTNCVDTKITTKDSLGIVILDSKHINLKATQNIKLNDIQITGNEISSENDIKLSANNLDISVNDILNLYSSNEIDISSNELDISCTDLSINCDETLDISVNDFDISTNTLDISVNKVNVTIAGIKFVFEKSNSGDTDKIIINHTNNITKTYNIDGDTGENACSIM
jgi:hypothetical protein